MKGSILVFALSFYIQLCFAQVAEPVSDDVVVAHGYYSLGYCEENEQAAWVFYKLYGDMVNGVAMRVNGFREDPLVLNESASLKDYRKSGYDRGHLCPAADMKINDVAMRESFYMSNMSPQVPSFNRGVWKKLEGMVRGLVSESDTIYVVTGPVFSDNLGSIGENNVTVPGYYYKVFYMVGANGSPVMKAFLIANEKSARDVESFAVSVDSVEVVTGIDFFRGVEGENALEGGDA